MPVNSIKFIVGAALIFVVVGCQKQEGKPSGATQHVADSSAPAPKPAQNKPVRNGPFGLAGGMSIAELSQLGFKESETSPNVFVGKPPKPLDGITDYSVFATPTAGVCRIRANHDVDLVNDSGDQLRTKVDQYAELMSVKYGKYSTKVNYTGREVYRNNPQFWMMALKEESVFYAYDWSTKKLETPLPDKMANIEVAANAISTSKGYVSIQYTYDNFEVCREEMKKKSATNL
ncbi:hypothetical protein E7V67_011425 [[Empedobacter] haloabium]|uniref:Lipoprotein n=1 Tax=[Empedobacter] haloabium TaxID=592317 RepID=A0ABZ1USI0_9BURK